MEELKDFLQKSTDRQNNPTENPAHIYNHLQRVVDHIAERVTELDQEIRLNTGIDAVDALTGGLRLGEFVVLCGEPASGKTSLVLHYAIQTAEEHKKPVWIYSRDHSAHQITVRLLSMLTGIPIWMLEEGQPNEEQWHRLMIAFSWLKEQDIRIYDLYMRMEDVKKSISEQGAPSLLILDGADPQMLDVSALKILGSIAKENHCCVLLTDYRFLNAAYVESGVDKELFLRRFPSTIHLLELTWNRYGKPGECDLHRRDDCLSFF